MNDMKCRRRISSHISHALFLSSLFLLVIFTAFGFVAPVPAQTTATVSIGDVCTIPNSSVIMPIMVNHVTNLGSGTIDVSYNPDIVHVADVESGTGNALKVQSWSGDNVNGTVQIVALDANAPHTGDVIFANVTYKAVATTGLTPLNITVRDLADYDSYKQIPHSVKNGTFTIIPQQAPFFDTGEGTYPSIMGIHCGNFTPKRNITVHQIYTYACKGTGGHSEYVVFYDYEDGEEIVNASWNGYKGDYHNISFKTPFTLHAGVVYTYEIRTGSYPQIIHRPNYENDFGTITCTKFIDANGRTYNNWIPAIRLFH